MRNIFKTIFVSVGLCLLFLSAAHAGELDAFIRNLNIQAEADLGKFKAKISTQFGVPVPKVDALIKTVDKPADAYMCLKVAQVAKQPQETVVREYQANKGKGWGVIAKNLGIKPGSKEFHELKSGNLDSASDDAGGNGKGKGKGKGRGHNK